jgi:hypothetical protein
MESFAAFPAQQRHVIELFVRHALGSLSHLSFLSVSRHVGPERECPLFVPHG